MRQMIDEDNALQGRSSDPSAQLMAGKSSLSGSQQRNKITTFAPDIKEPSQNSSDADAFRFET